MSKYNNVASFCISTKCINVLAFIPLYGLDIATDELTDKHPGELVPIYEWLEKLYFRKKNRRIDNRRKPCYSLNMWDLHQQILESKNWIYNTAKAANRHLSL